MFVKTLTADDKYSLPNSENLQKTIKMQLSKILKTFSRSFAELVQSTSNFKHFEKKKMSLVPYVFSKLPTVKGTITQMFKWHRVIAHFHSQHVQRCKTLAKSP